MTSVPGVPRAARRTLLRTLAGVARAAGGHARPRSGARRLLVLLPPDSSREAILATGLLRAMRLRNPGAAIDVLASEADVDVFADSVDVHTVFSYQREHRGELLRAAVRLRGEHYDGVVDAAVEHDDVWSGAVLLMLASGARRRVGLAGRGLDDVFTTACPPRVAGEHHLDTLRSLGRAYAVAPEDDLRPRLYLSDEEFAAAEARWAEGGTRGPRVLVNVSADQPRRRWPDDRYAAALRRLRYRAPMANLAVIGEEADAESVQTLAAAAGATALEHTLRETFATVATADLVITPDAPAVHAASSFGTPVVAMLVAGQLAFAPYRAPGATVVSDADFLTSLPVDRVLRALDAGLAAARQHSRTAAVPLP